MATTTPRPATAPTAPAEQVARDARQRKVIAALKGKPRVAADAAHMAEQQHWVDPLDHDFEQMPCANPEACSCPDDYPGWTPGRTA